MESMLPLPVSHPFLQAARFPISPPCDVFNNTDSSMNFAEFVENYDMQLLNSNITTEEVLKAAKSLKNGKAGGPDGILNEMLKISCIYNTTAYVNLFTTILKSGIYPELWRENYIKPNFQR